VAFIFKGVFGFEKDRHRYTKDLILEVIIFLITFFILYYLFGVVISFYKNDDYYTLLGLVDFIAPAIFYVLVKEYLRYMIMCKAEGSNLLFATTVLIFILLDITTVLYFKSFDSSYNVFIFIALTFLPALSSNIVLCYFTTRTGYKPLILYSMVISLYQYLLPILPNPNEYISSVIKFILPVAFGYKLYKFLNKTKKREIDLGYRNRSFRPLVASTIIIIILVYFTSGYFKYWAVAVASGSMSPKVNKGDVVIIEKIDGKYEKLKKGQIIAFQYGGVIVVHRLINIIEDEGQYYFYTKGDANVNPDNYAVREDMVVGTVNKKIPYIGIPTVWLNEMY